MRGPTYVALSSGSLPSGVAVIRLSGPRAFDAVRALAGELPPARHAALRTLKDQQTGHALDKGLVLVFPGPNSFTGEDCAELQVHGSPAGIKAILSTLTAMDGLKLAGPGDFTRLAFENGKLDLTAVEGLGDLLAAETEGQRRQALARLDGVLSEQIGRWREKLLDVRAEIEAHLDFSDEDDVPFALPEHFARDLAQLSREIEATLADFERGRVTREGFQITLAGHPNAGKSSLLNALAGSEIAIVTDEAGTTRDTKDIGIDLAGTLAVFTDTAGLREAESRAEREGVERARRAMDRADLVLWLVAPDVEDDQTPPLSDTEMWVVATKADMGPAPKAGDISISTHDRSTIEALLSRLDAHIREKIGADQPALISHLRDQEALTIANAHLANARSCIGQPELCAHELRQTSDSLARLIGMMDTEQILDRLFSGFCIGK